MALIAIIPAINSQLNIKFTAFAATIKKTLNASGPLQPSYQKQIINIGYGNTAEGGIDAPNPPFRMWATRRCGWQHAKIQLKIFFFFKSDVSFSRIVIKKKKKNNNRTQKKKRTNERQRPEAANNNNADVPGSRPDTFSIHQFIRNWNY